MPRRSANPSSSSWAGPVPTTTMLQRPMSFTQARNTRSSPFSGSRRPRNPIVRPGPHRATGLKGNGDADLGNHLEREGRLLAGHQLGRQLVHGHHAVGMAEDAGAAEPAHRAGGARETFAGEHEVGDMQTAGQRGGGGRRAGPGLLLDLDQLGTEVGEEPPKRRAAPGEIAAGDGAAPDRNGDGAHTGVVAVAGLLLGAEPDWCPAVGHGGGDADAESGERLELPPGRGVGIDPRHHDRTHVSAPVARSTRRRGRPRRRLRTPSGTSRPARSSGGGAP